MGRGGRGLNEAERQTLGGALRQLRMDNVLTLADVARFHRTLPSAVSRWEHGKAYISPAKALDVLTSLVTSLDGEVLNATVAAIPPLALELQFQQMIDQAVADGSAWQYGAAAQIAAALEGKLSYTMVWWRLNHAKKGR